jgi:hypothetical protein
MHVRVPDAASAMPTCLVAYDWLKPDVFALLAVRATHKQ